MAYTGSEGSMITRTLARQLLNNYQSSSAFAANNNTEGILFGKDHLNSILAQPGCTGIRIYYGKDGIMPSDAAQLVIVGINSSGDDMTGLILDAGLPCPTHCPSAASKI